MRNATSIDMPLKAVKHVGTAMFMVLPCQSTEYSAKWQGHLRETASLIRDALQLQHSIGFESAFQKLRARGVDIELARTLLSPYFDRRVKERRNLATRPTQVEWLRQQGRGEA